MSVGELLGSTISKMTNTSVSCLPFLGGWFQIYFHFHFHLGKFSLVGSFAASWSFGCNLRGLENFEAILYNFGLEYFEAIHETFCKNEARSEMSPLQDSNPLQGWRPCFHEESSQGNLFSFLALFNLFFFVLIVYFPLLQVEHDMVRYEVELMLHLCLINKREHDTIIKTLTFRFVFYLYDNSAFFGFVVSFL